MSFLATIKEMQKYKENATKIVRHVFGGSWYMQEDWCDDTVSKELMFKLAAQCYEYQDYSYRDVYVPVTLIENPTDDALEKFKLEYEEAKKKALEKERHEREELRKKQDRDAEEGTYRLYLELKAKYEKKGKSK